jgi:hypothetical protein
MSEGGPSVGEMGIVPAPEVVIPQRTSQAEQVAQGAQTRQEQDALRAQEHRKRQLEERKAYLPGLFALLMKGAWDEALNGLVSAMPSGQQQGHG